MCQAAYLYLIKTWDNQSAAVREGTEFSEVFESCKMLVPCKMSPLQTRTAFEVATCKVCSLSNLQSSSSWNSAHFNGTAMLRHRGTNRGHESPLLSTLTCRPCQGFWNTHGWCLYRQPFPRLCLSQGPCSYSGLFNYLQETTLNASQSWSLRFQSLLPAKPSLHPTVLPATHLLSNPSIISPLSTELSTNFLKVSGSQTVVHRTPEKDSRAAC